MSAYATRVPGSCIHPRVTCCCRYWCAEGRQDGLRPKLMEGSSFISSGWSTAPPGACLSEAAQPINRRHTWSYGSPPKNGPHGETTMGSASVFCSQHAS